VVPALRKVREERGTHWVGDGCEIKSPGHPPTITIIDSASSKPQVIELLSTGT